MNSTNIPSSSFPAGKPSVRWRLFWLALLGALAGYFYLRHPATQYRSVCRQDTISAYEGFLSRFPDGPRAAAVRDRLHVLYEEPAWRGAQASGQIIRLRAYLRDYPEGRYATAARGLATNLADAEWDKMSKPYEEEKVRQFFERFPEVTRIRAAQAVLADAREGQSISRLHGFQRLFPKGPLSTEATNLVQALIDKEWEKVATSRSEDTLQQHLKDFPESAHGADVEARIRALYSDFSWVKEKDTIAAYQRFLDENPRSTNRVWAEKRIIDLEVADISKREHGTLPSAEPTEIDPLRSTATVEIKNQTGYVLTVRYSGEETSKKFVIPVGATEVLTLARGFYRVAASVTALHVQDYFGTETLVGGGYAVRFFIGTRSAEKRSWSGGNSDISTFERYFRNRNPLLER